MVQVRFSARVGQYALIATCRSARRGFRPAVERPVRPSPDPGSTVATALHLFDDRAHLRLAQRAAEVRHGRLVLVEL